jgi:acyl carrier protein
MNVSMDSLAEVIAGRFNLPRESIAAETSFEEMGLDSLSRIELSLSIHKELGIQIDDEEIDKMATVSDLLGFINRMQ